MISSYERDLAALERPSSRITFDGSTRFWRMDDPVIGADGMMIKGGMWKHQRDWWNLPTFVKALVTGYGGGKSYALCKRAISSALVNSGCMIAVISPTMRVARRTTIITLVALLEGKKQLYGPSFWYRHNKSTSEIFIRFRGKVGHILILSAENPEHLKGPNLAAAYLDEPFIMHEDVFTQMVARVRDPKAKLKEIALCGTPEQLGWGYNLLKTKKNDRDLKAVQDLTKVPLSIGMVNASTAANKVLDQDYVKRLMARLSPKAVEAYINGKFVNLTEGRVFYAFDEDNNVKRIMMPEYAELGVGIDFNVNPMSANVFWKKGSRVHVFDEYALENSDTEYLAGKLNQDYPNLRDTYPDPAGNQRKTNSPSGRTDFYYLRQAGYVIHAPSSHYGLRDSINIVNGMFRPGIDTKKPRLTIDPKCTKLIEALNAYSWELAPKQEKYKHCLDALRYPMANLFPLPTDRIGTNTIYGT